MADERKALFSMPGDTVVESQELRRPKRGMSSSRPAWAVDKSKGLKA